MENRERLATAFSLTGEIVLFISGIVSFSSHVKAQL